MNNQRFAQLVKSAIDETIPSDKLDFIAATYNSNQGLDVYVNNMDNELAKQFRDSDGSLIIKELVAAILYSINKLREREGVTKDFNELFKLLQAKILLELTYCKE